MNSTRCLKTPSATGPHDPHFTDLTDFTHFTFPSSRAFPPVVRCPVKFFTQ